MAFTLNKVVPWGRSFNEYTAMFALSETDLGKRILGCADGPASFNCILTKRGGRVL
ncbi:MAG: SAM-dependent methyltransferase, partial [Thermodesulfobacteriota bacterium]|nr:SAM-dependent methyltransferase [Thermodesulfobacteriota bacterium]